VHRVIERSGSVTVGGSDQKVADAKSAGVGWPPILAGFRWAPGGADLKEDFLPYLHVAGMRSKVLEEARDWPAAWRSFVEASGGRLGFDQVEADRALKARFRSLYVRTALIRAEDLRDQIVGMVASAVVLFGCMTALVALVASNLGAAVLVGTIALAVLFVLHRLLAALLKASTGGRWPLVVLCSLAAAGSIGSATWLARHSLGYTWPITSVPRVSDYRGAFDAGVVIGLVGLPISMAAVLVASIAGSSVAGRRRIRSHPDAMLFGAFVEILGYLGSGPAKLASLAARRRTAQSFERAAYAVEYGLRHSLRLSDPGNDLALRNKLYPIASMIRSHQVSFVLSEKVAFVELSNLCVRTIRSVCSGALGSLASPPSAAMPSRSFGRSLLAPLQQVVVALAPGAVVLALVWRGALSADPFGHAVVVAAVSWAVMSLLVTLDPVFTDRLSATSSYGHEVRTRSRGSRTVTVVPSPGSDRSFTSPS
jgi:hypothetical protein